ncbi:hypothetical protein BC831DRAFT_432142 [Entophlyctis helioformis]|nr:hypothetical protein BC831DRAFT_432142 [Entophlyctis helioformis]
MRRRPAGEGPRAWIVSGRCVGSGLSVSSRLCCLHSAASCCCTVSQRTACSPLDLLRPPPHACIACLVSRRPARGCPARDASRAKPSHGNRPIGAADTSRRVHQPGRRRACLPCGPRQRVRAIPAMPRTDDTADTDRPPSSQTASDRPRPLTARTVVPRERLCLRLRRRLAAACACCPRSDTPPPALAMTASARPTARTLRHNKQQQQQQQQPSKSPPRTASRPQPQALPLASASSLPAAVPDRAAAGAAIAHPQPVPTGTPQPPAVDPPLKSLVRAAILARVEAEAPLIAYLQTRLSNPLTNAFADVASLLGTHHAFLLLTPTLFWFTGDVVSSSVRIYALGLVGVLAWCNLGTGMLKDAMSLPRPPTHTVQRRAELKSSALEYGFPSTHTANAVGFSLFTACLYARVAPGDSATWWWLAAVLFEYAAVVAASRILKGMHSFVDLAGGAVVGVVVACVQLWLLDSVEAAMLSDMGQMVPFLVFLVAVLALVMHPDPDGPCPCYDDSLCFLAAWTGAVAGVWHNIQVVQRSAEMAAASVQLAQQLSVWSVLMRLVFGTAFLAAWRYGMKRFCVGALPLVMARIGGMFGGSGASGKHAASCECHHGPSAATAATATATAKAPSDASDAALSTYRLPKYELESIVRFVVYAGIGLLTADTIPVCFVLLGI